MPDPHPRRQLCLIVEQYGQGIMTEPKRCRALLNDLAPQFRLENNLLVMVLEQDIARQLLNPSALMPIELQLERLAQSLHEAVGLEEELAYWATESWALALGVIERPVFRQMIQPKYEALALPVLPPSTETVLKQNQRLSRMVFYVVGLIGCIFVAGFVVFFLKTKLDNKVLKTPAVNQAVLEAQKFEEPLANTLVTEQHDAWTENNLGDKYYYGFDVAKNYKKAAEWYFRSAQQGDALAQCNLAYMYFNGYGVTKDYQKAAELYRKAAEQGNADGQNNLGIMYENGYGVEKDIKKAVEWYSKAVEQGHYGAQQTLKKLLEKS